MLSWLCFYTYISVFPRLHDVENLLSVMFFFPRTDICFHMLTLTDVLDNDEARDILEEAERRHRTDMDILYDEYDVKGEIDVR